MTSPSIVDDSNQNSLLYRQGFERVVEAKDEVPFPTYTSPVYVLDSAISDDSLL